MKTRNFLPLMLMLAILLLPSLLFAAYDPGCNCDPGGDPDAVNAPIDGGLSILLAAGVGYGAKKAYNKKKQNESDKAL